MIVLTRDSKSKTTDIAKTLIKHGISARDVYYAGEALDLIENIGDHLNNNEAEILNNKLKDQPELKDELVDLVVDMTCSYESPIRHEDFIREALDVIREEESLNGETNEH